MKTFCLTQLQPSSDVPHPNIRFLGIDDIFLDSWDESKVMQRTIWNDPKTCSSGSPPDVIGCTMM
jgi:hypothetical protein